MRKVIKLLSPAVWFFLKSYWFVFRPTSYGVKIIITNKNSVLLVRHNYGYKTWTFPGGCVKKGENKESAIKREIEEEVGIKLDKITFLGHFVSTKEHKKDNIFVCHSEVKNKNFKKDVFEIKEAKWFDINNPPSLPENSRKILDFYKNY